ncbi:probable threonine--tRNA ligase 2, cytoplasmic [Poecilia reticulata]|uniref:probable threonine--tRNA ligase 2, cytoplasmic n=1 Tax=Poecilia reticulata TaxID=8081 RepID=UPI0007EA335D|nr:PREDICTED: probable threonine--tRNA ligase 2, cytoplasmic [Poecilia reticulata]
MAHCLAARLGAQEEQIRLLTAEISALRDGLNGGSNRAGVASVSPELENLRAENEKLRYRLLHLRRGLQAELEMEEALGRKQTEAQCGKTPERNIVKPQQTDSRTDNGQVPIPDKKPSEKNKKKQDKGRVDGGTKELNPWPPYVTERLSLYEELKKESDALLARKAAESKPIIVELTDGQKVPGKSWVTTPYQIASDISQGLADSAVISLVNGELWDLDRPLEQDCSLEILRFDNEDAQAVYWHSSAHILGEAMERFYGGCLCYGPPIENGFYYDMFLDGQKSVSSTEFGDLEALCKSVVKEKQPFERLEISKETLLKMFKYNKFKCRILNEKVTTPTTTVYRCGPLIDLCRGPHVRHTGKIKAMKIYKNSSTYWEGRSDMETLQRIYGISFPDSKMLKEWEHDIFALKPMNCPGHCLMFSHRPRSWRELPLRLADFGVLHRNELSGTLTGLTRVRRFQQDDAHIFCVMDQIESEMKGCLDFLRCVYDVFGFSFQLYLSTRPEKYLGDIALWNQAEKQLENSLNEFGEPWKLNPGDGAFYGPKIDIKIKDAIGRYHQCATIQLDFQLPIRFNLTFVGKDGDDKARPVIIHRAILGSVERMIAILTENYVGKWPLWLSPRQVMLVPVNPSCEDYANKVCKQFTEAGFMADADLDSGCLLNKKIRNAQLAQYNFILVVGEKEKMTNSVNVRTRDNKVHGELPVSEVMARLTLLKQSRCRNAEEEF